MSRSPPLTTPVPAAAPARTLSQLLRYGVVGLASNVALYLVYLGLTAAGLGHKLAMSLVYGAGVALTFFVNGRWTFTAGSLGGATFARYVTAYGLGYALNLVLLWLLVDVGGWPHAPAQGLLILVVAGCLFLLHKFWVFRPPPTVATFATDRGAQ